MRRSAILVWTVVVLLGLLAGARPAAAAADPGCQTPFFVFSDPAVPGESLTAGDLTIIRGGGVLGEYQGSGRLAGYALAGVQDITLNQATQTAEIQGQLTATSPDGDSSLILRYSGRADLATGIATGHFVALGQTGDLAGYVASGSLEATLVGPASFAGVDIGLC